MSEQAKQEMKVLTETETDQVAGGGNAWGKQVDRSLGEHPWQINGGNALNAPGHQ